MRGSYPGAKTPRRARCRRATASARSRSSPRRATRPATIAFLDTRDHTLIAGDAYSTIGGVATTAKVNPRFPFPVLATWHRPTALETARALRALDPARLAVGHGPIVDAPGAAMDAAIAKAARPRPASALVRCEQRVVARGSARSRSRRRGRPGR